MHSRFLFLFCLATLFNLTAAELKRLPRENLLAYRDARGVVREGSTIAHWQKRRADVLAGMQSVMGRLPGREKRAPFDVKVEEETDCGSYVRRLITYQSEPGSRTPAYLCIPKKALTGKSKVPAVLCLHPTDNKIGHKVAVGEAYGFFEGEPPLRPLIKVHPVTGRPALYIGRHAGQIPGFDLPESEKLLDELMTFICQPPRTFMHRWTPGDVAVWDNRCLLHRARPYDHREEREMIHTRIKGEVASETSLNG